MYAWHRGLIVAAGMLVLVGCPEDGGGSGGTDTDTDTDGTSGGVEDADLMPDSTDDGVDDTSTGGVPSDALVPCDPRDAGPCAVGVCAGAGHSGYYCRPACSAMAVLGDPCGSDDVCLPTGSDEDLACFNIDDCDFLTGDGCNADAGESCAILTFEPVRTACVPALAGSVGASCGPAGALACDPGLGCLGTDLDGDDAGACQPWCSPGDPLPDGCGQCIALTEDLGTCAECSVLAQDCPEGEACNPINELLGGVCVPFGPGLPGDPCNPFDPDLGCQEGSLCFEVEDDIYACVQICDPGDPMCDSAMAACVDVGLIVPRAEDGLLGLCIEGADQFCDPDADPTGCPGRDACLGIEPGVGICGAGCDPTTGAAACEGNSACAPIDDASYFNIVPFVEGNGACGVGCSNDGECGGGTCLLTDGLESDGICGTTCTPPVGAECAAGEQCVPTPAAPAVGACIAIGDPCDPDTLGGNCPEAAACVVLDGGGSAVCVPPCFEQDPNGCTGVPASCQVKTASAWHGGVCLGGGEACDPVGQDCGPDATCTLIAGQAFGGIAYLCDDAGSVAEGGDCSDNTCAEGLDCFDDACVAYCDPGAADTCSVGACTDISAVLYLPTNTLGACL